MQTIGDNLRRLRKRAGLTQKALAAKATVSRSTIAVIETGDRSNYETGTLDSLAMALGVPTTDLYPINPAPSPPHADESASGAGESQSNNGEVV